MAQCFRVEKSGLHTDEITYSRPFFHYFLNFSNHPFEFPSLGGKSKYKARLQSKLKKQDGGRTSNSLCCYFSLTCNSYEIKQMASTIEKDRKLCYGDSKLFLYYARRVELYKLPFICCRKISENFCVVNC